MLIFFTETYVCDFSELPVGNTSSTRYTRKSTDGIRLDGEKYTFTGQRCRTVPMYGTYVRYRVPGTGTDCYVKLAKLSGQKNYFSSEI